MNVFPWKTRLTVLVLALQVSAAFAGDVILFRRGETPDPEDIARLLKGGNKSDGSGAPRARTRGIKLTAEDAPVAQTAAPLKLRSTEQGAASVAPAEDAPVTFALQIQFPFDSAAVQPDMHEALDAVAAGVKLAGNLKIIVEGHTDATGSVDYNLNLSKKRAEAVKSYLVAHGLVAANLKAVGRGMLEPLVKENPSAPENRRVQFRTQG
jgi:outer membrane protein OmpA-like peptidoglycan-associated protein